MFFKKAVRFIKILGGGGYAFSLLISTSKAFILRGYKNKAVNLLRLLKTHLGLQYTSLMDLCVLDLGLVQQFRYRLNYVLASNKLCHRLVVVIKLSDLDSAHSISNLYCGAGWVEREA